MQLLFLTAVMISLLSVTHSAIGRHCAFAFITPFGIKVMSKYKVLSKRERGVIKKTMLVPKVV